MRKDSKIFLAKALDYAKKINDYLLNLEVIKEYQKYEKIIHQDNKIIE